MYYAQPSWYIRTSADQGPAARREREDELVPREHQVRPLRRLAEQQRRLGAVPGPVLGHAAADLAQRRRPGAAGRRRLAGRAVRADRPRPLRPGPAPAVHRRRHLHRCPARRARTAASAGDRRLVRLGLDAVRPVGCAAPQPGGVRGRLPGAVHLRGDRPDPRLVLHADGGRHAGVRPKSSYENVLCLGHILAEDGRKMSKHLGNILEPIPLMDRHGADAVRWFMLAGGSPWSARRVGHETLSEVVRKVLLTYWNTASFFTLYAEANGWDPAVAPAPAAGRTPAAGPLGAGRARRRHRGRHRRRWRTSTPRRAGRLLAELRRRPVQLVRPPLPPALLGRRPGGPGHPARGAGRTDPADGAVHPVRHRGGVGAGRLPGLGRQVENGAADSVHLASWPDGRRRRPRRRTGGAGGARPPAGRARPFGAHVGEGAHPPAAGPCPRRGARLVGAAP